MKEQLVAARFWKIKGKMINRLWDEEGAGPVFAKGHFEPPIDVYETQDGLVVRMEIPGMKKRDISVELEEDTLIIKGLRDDTSRGPKVGYYQMEINYGTFERRIRIYMPIRENKLTAFYRDGFLEVRLPGRRSSGESST
jgi:HSP20 family protein